METRCLREWISEDLHLTQEDVVKMATELLNQMEKRGEDNSSFLVFTLSNIFMKQTEGIRSFWYEDVSDTQLFMKEKHMYMPCLEDDKMEISVTLYSLGMIMYQLLNENRFPFVEDGMSYHQIQKMTERRFSECLPPISDIDEKFYNVLSKLCDYREDMRYQDVRKLQEDLYALSLVDEEPEAFFEDLADGSDVKEQEVIRSTNGKTSLVVNHLLHRRYRIVRVIGAGGFGITYEAWDEKMAMKVAIKEYFPKNLVARNAGDHHVTVMTQADALEYKKGLKRFINEAKSLAKMSNYDVIVNVFDYFEENHTAYIIMEYLEGKSLKTHLDECGQLPLDRVVHLMKILANALQEVHDRGLVHRDINPDNIFLCENDRVHIIDFGAAKNIDTHDKKTQTVILTPQYAPLEQFQKQSRNDATLDVYALGATMYKTLTGQTPPSAIDRIGTDRLVAPRKIRTEVPVELEQIVLKCMALYPKDRYQTMQELLEDLMESDKRSSSKWNAASEVVKKHFWKITGICVCLILLMSVGIVRRNSIELYGYPCEIVLRMPTNWFDTGIDKQVDKVNIYAQTYQNELKEKQRIEEEKAQKAEQETVSSEKTTESDTSAASSNEEKIDEKLMIPDSDIIDVN
ncbi:MAG: hypothetical protein E7264_03420 [Lachnospiraceae bacterium]|nr:hypothetical protein [Lachnospiraceae bacterium]